MESAEQSSDTRAVREVIDRFAIQDSLHRYARGVDRGDWDLVRAAYHPDAHDDHGDYNGDVDGLIAWLDARFAGVDNSTHFVGSTLIEFAHTDLALVETYFISSRLRAPEDGETGSVRDTDAVARQSWGRYVDRFERRDGQWRVARRTVVIDARFTSVAHGGLRGPGGSGRPWGQRDGTDQVEHQRRELGLDR